MYLALIALPLISSIVSGFFGRKVGVSGAQIITCIIVIGATILTMMAFFEIGFNNKPVSVNLIRWIDSESLDAIWQFNFDSLTVSMLIPVLIVSSLVHIYSLGYMSHDPHNQRFFSYLSLFTFMMIILVTSKNLLSMFVGWEGVGVCSYLLVSFWFTRIAANQSSISAFLTNRVGDCFLTLGMFAVLWSFGNIDYTTIFSLAPFVNENIVTIIGICLLIGAMAKSSQVGLHVWLPMAMEGPTPVSALIHAATMVTAGVYLLMRTSPLIEYSSTVLILCLSLGAITTIFSSLIGLFQQDIKKVIAYSTMSQLGMMVIAVGLSSYNIALFHLINHAFYKALLFLGAGAVIHAVADNQDFRKYGGLKSFLPLTYSVMLIASLSLVAFPFMTGFYSKDFILESSYGQFSFISTIVYTVATVGAIFTTLYSIKVLYLTFLTNPNGPVVNYNHAHEGDMFMSMPLIILAIFSIFFGYIAKDIYIGLGTAFFLDNSLFIHPVHEILLDTEFAVSTLFKLIPFVFTVYLTVVSIFISELLANLLFKFKFSRLGYNLFGLYNQRLLIEFIYNKYVTGLIMTFGNNTSKILDKGSVELLGPFGLEKGLINLSKSIGNLSNNVITSYALYILIGLIFYLSIPYIGLVDNGLIILLILGLSNVLIDVNSLYLNNKTINSYGHILVASHKNSILSFFKILLLKLYESKPIYIFLVRSVVLYIFIVVIPKVIVYMETTYPEFMDKYLPLNYIGSVVVSFILICPSYLTSLYKVIGSLFKNIYNSFKNYFIANIYTLFKNICVFKDYFIANIYTLFENIRALFNNIYSSIKNYFIAKYYAFRDFLKNIYSSIKNYFIAKCYAYMNFLKNICALLYNICSSGKISHTMGQDPSKHNPIKLKFNEMKPSTTHNMESNSNNNNPINNSNNQNNGNSVNPASSNNNHNPPLIAFDAANYISRPLQYYAVEARSRADELFGPIPRAPETSAEEIKCFEYDNKMEESQTHNSGVVKILCADSLRKSPASRNPQDENNVLHALYWLHEHRRNWSSHSDAALQMIHQGKFEIALNRELIDRHKILNDNMILKNRTPLYPRKSIIPSLPGRYGVLENIPIRSNSSSSSPR